MYNISSLYKVFQYTQNSIELETDLYIAAKQISQEIITGKNFNVSETLSYNNEQNEEISIILDNNRIVKTPGFQIYAFNIDELNFERKNDLIYMKIKRDNNIYSFLVGGIFENI